MANGRSNIRTNKRLTEQIMADRRPNEQTNEKQDD